VRNQEVSALKPFPRALFSLPNQRINMFQSFFAGGKRHCDCNGCNIARFECLFFGNIKAEPYTVPDFLLRFLSHLRIQVSDILVGVPHPKSFEVSRDAVLATRKLAEFGAEYKEFLP
jgi:hypothetical protein